MARKPSQESLTDIPEIAEVPGGFANIPLPPQELIDQEANEPDDPNTPPTPIGRPRQRRQPAARVASQGTRTMERTAQEVIDAFMQEISNHPDFKVMTSSIGGRPGKSVEFTDTPTANQHLAEVRFVWRDPQSRAIVPEHTPSPYEPGGRYYDLIQRKGEPEEVEPENKGGESAWGNLVKKREKDARDIHERETVAT